MRLLSFDPAGKKFGIAGIEFLQVDAIQGLDLYMSHVIEAPESFNSSQRTQYMSHVAAAIAGISKPDMIVSEKPWGMGFSSQTLKELIGALKADIWQSIQWQGVSEARKAVLGEGWGGANKKITADWLLQYPWSISSKRYIKSLIETANPETDDGYDILDAILHALCYLIVNNGLIPIFKEKKVKKNGKSKSKDQETQS